MTGPVSSPDIPSEEATLQVGPVADAPVGGLSAPVGSALDRYVVIEEIGRGGMGVVLRAYDPKLQREVALKVLRAASAESEARLVREARAMAQLSHPNVVAVYDVAVRDEDAQSQVALAMEFVPGTDLRHWLEQQDRGCDEVLEAFAAAGQGLAAAHSEGLLHRDFKPGNVLVGDDGRVRVTDFGLARLRSSSSLDDGAPSSRSSGSDSDLSVDRLTEVGSVVGTPRFMAPEQHGAMELSPAVDQYAFCVSLWFALTGLYPFRERSIRALQEAKLEGPPPWPGPSSVPSRVVNAVLRGLSPHPDNRFPSMDALLTQLTPTPRSAARAWIAGGLAVGVLGAGAWAVSTAYEDARCTGAEQQLAQVWSPQRRESIEGAFAGADVSYGAEAWSHLGPRLDEWTTSWGRMHTEACEATQLRGEQSAAAMDLRMACLQRARVKLDAVADVLEEASPGVIERAHEVVDGLPALADCADIQALQSDVAPPTAQQQSTVQDIRATLAQAGARRDAAEFGAASEGALQAQSRAIEIEYEPVLTEALLLLSDVQLRTAKYPEAEATARQALELATRLGQRDEQRRAVLLVMRAVGVHTGKPDEGLVLREFARALSMDTPRNEADYRSNLARVLQAAGRFEETEREYRAVLKITEELFGDKHPRLATHHMNLAGVLFEQARYEEAEAQGRISLELAVEAYGPMHPRVGQATVNLASNFLETGRYPEAIELFTEAIEILTRSVGADNPATAAAYSNLAGVYFKQGKFDESLAWLKKATDSRIAAYGPRHAQVADARTNLAAIYHRTGRPQESLVEQTAAHEIYLEQLGPDHPRTLTSAQNIGNAHLALGRYADAEAVYRDALARQLPSLGPDHKDVLRSKNNLATVLHKRGRLVEAEALFREVLAKRTDLFGPEHDAVGQSWGNLSNVLAGQGRLDEAEEAQRKALQIGVSAHGADHDDVGASRHSLAAILRKRGDHEAARVEQQEALRIWHDAFGDRHLRVAQAHGGLGEIHNALGHHQAAEQELRTAVDIAKHTAQRHPVVGERLVALGRFLLDRGRRSEAIEVLERAWSIADERMGDTPDKAAAAYALARALGGTPRAIELAKSARAIYADVGSAHADKRAAIDRFIAKHS